MTKRWEPAFPNLGRWEEHSQPTPVGGQIPRYNCFAFAAGDDMRRWEPDLSMQYYWPTTNRAFTIPAFIEAFQTRRYEVCSGGMLEHGSEKIVFYADRFRIVQHAARQISDGRWISKLGDEEDIIHETPQSLTSVDYGQPICYMKRPIY
jgi:hypothetical protein